MLQQTLVILIYLIHLSVVFAIVFMERKNPTSTLAWIVVLIFLPIIGVLLYLMFGRGFKIGTKKRLEIKSELNKKYNTPDIKNKLNIIQNKECSYHENSYYTKLLNMFCNISKSIYSKDNDVQVFTNGKDKFESLYQDIKNAKKTINVLYFIISNDETGKKFVSLLAAKARQGVKIRLIYDDMGSISTPSLMFRRLRKAGGKVKKFSPLLVGSILYANYRNHRKIVVIDGNIAYTGGMNVGDEYLGMNKKLSPWRDTHLRITGTAVLSLQFIFLMDWHYVTNYKYDIKDDLSEEYFPAPIKKGNIGMQIVSSGPDTSRQEIKTGMVSMIYNAKESVMIQTPYFIPDEPFMEALKSAKTSGVDVMLMIPQKTDHRSAAFAAGSYIQTLLDYGIKVYRYKGFIHAKMIVADGKIATIGTTNIDIRSFSLHFEVNAFIYDEELSAKLKAIYEEDLKNSQAIIPEEYAKRSMKRKALESIMRLLSPLF